MFVVGPEVGEHDTRYADVSPLLLIPDLLVIEKVDLLL